MTQTKRYLTTDTLTTDLPVEFVTSKNKRHIVVVGCRFFINEPAIDDAIETFHTPKFVTLHADFIHDRRDLDSFVMFCNEPIIKRKKYEQLGS